MQYIVIFEMMLEHDSDFQINAMVAQSHLLLLPTHVYDDWGCIILHDYINC